MLASIILPTRARPAILETCLRHLAAQTLSLESFEVLVGLDGPDDASASTADRVALDTGLRVVVVPCPRLGVGGVKNQLLPRARGNTLLFINDDVFAHPACLESHLAAQREALRTRPRGAMILGASPWAVREPDSLFDRLIRETSMIFFYDRMPESPPDFDPDHDWGFRHAWNLNLSVPADAVREVGGFNRDPANLYGYEDLELAWRLSRHLRMPVLFRPNARALHHHFYDPDGYLLREQRLGHAALGFARIAPECAREVFRRDITTEEEADCSRAAIERESPSLAPLLESFRRLAHIPANSISGPHAPDLLRLIYQQHLPLKRLAWRQGLLAAASRTHFPE